MVRQDDSNGRLIHHRLAPSQRFSLGTVPVIDSPTSPPSGRDTFHTAPHTETQTDWMARADPEVRMLVDGMRGRSQTKA
jgi:hypothetical protein